MLAPALCHRARVQEPPALAVKTRARDASAARPALAATAAMRPARPRQLVPSVSRDLPFMLMPSIVAPAFDRPPLE